MPEAAEAKPVRRRRATKPPTLTKKQQHEMAELAEAMGRLADALTPLSEHVPVLIEIAKTWNAAANTGRTIGRGATLLAATGKWAAGMGITFAAIWAIVHQKWEALLGAAK